MRIKTGLITLIASSALLVAANSYAEDYVITLKDNTFSPAVLTIPAKEAVKITVKNMNTTPAEFESSDLNREKVVAAGSKVTVSVGPLEAGSYEYVNDFHKEAKGTILVK